MYSWAVGSQSRQGRRERRRRLLQAGCLIAFREVVLTGARLLPRLVTCHKLVVWLQSGLGGAPAGQHQWTSCNQLLTDPR